MNHFKFFEKMNSPTELLHPKTLLAIYGAFNSSGYSTSVVFLQV